MKSFKKVLALVLAVIMIAAAAIPGATAAKKEKTEADLIKEASIKTKIVNTLVDDIILDSLGRIIPRMDFVRNDAEDLDDSFFFEGNDVILPTASDKFVWNVGYGSESIIPDDFGVPFKYARGSYCPWGYSRDFYTDDDGNPEDLKVRAVAFDDNTGRGVSVICSVDCIGISNRDVLKIREGLADVAKQNNIVSVEISAIHSHMSIDSQGVWGAPLTTIINNFLSLTGFVKSKSGVNKDYLDTIIKRTKQAVTEACTDMRPGKLTYTDVELEDYMGTRTVAPECDGNLHRLVFTPDNGRPTVIASFGAHPEATSYGAEFNGDLSADFVYYMEKLVNAAGSNFIFVQGNVGTNSCWRGNSNDGLDLADNHESALRYGYEMAYICLGATMNTEERAALNDELGDKLGVKENAGKEDYTVWYEGLPTFEEIPVEAVLNVKHSRVKLEIENGTALVLLKLGLATNDIAWNESNGKYYTTTEIGFMQFGSAVNVVLSPGEMYSELIVGGYGMRNSDYPYLREIFGENTILCDLMNDAAGYICPDETYCSIGFKYNPATGEVESDSWCLAVSIGRPTASTLMNAYVELAKDFNL